MPNYASISPKPVYYRVNGTGRDTYIDFNSGGLIADKQIAQFPSIGTFGNNNHLGGGRVFEKRPNLGNKVILYRANGSGRDSYCYSSKGGFVADSSQVDLDGPQYFSRTQSNLSPSKVTPPMELQSDRSLNFFVGQLRSYQRPSIDLYTQQRKAKARKQMVKQIIQEQVQLARSKSLQNFKDSINKNEGSLLMPKIVENMDYFKTLNSQASTQENTPLSLTKQESHQSPLFSQKLPITQQLIHFSTPNNRVTPFNQTQVNFGFSQTFQSPSRLNYLKQKQHTLDLAQPRFVKGERKSNSQLNLKRNSDSNKLQNIERVQINGNELIEEDMKNLKKNILINRLDQRKKTAAQ
eukprot:403356075